MPDDYTPQRDRPPDYGFARFDRWMAQLKQCIPDGVTYATVVAAIEEAGRDLNLDRLATTHDLSEKARRLVRQLARFGDVGRRPFYAFASVCIAVISPPRRHADGPTTYIMVTRRRGQLDYWWIDSADSGFSGLGIRRQPLTQSEAVRIVEEVIAAQAAWDVVDGADRSAYVPERASQLRIRSQFYPNLEPAFRAQARRKRRSTDHRRRPQ